MSTRATGPRAPVTRPTAAERPKRASHTTTTRRRVAAPYAGPRGADLVPAPALLDQGSDYPAIAASLLGYARWIEWHDPDPALIVRACTRGTRLAASVANDVANLRRAGRHIEEVDRSPFELTVVSRLENVVSFHMTERLARRDLVDALGHVVSHVGLTDEHYGVLITRDRAGAPWRLLTVDLAPPPVEVRL